MEKILTDSNKRIVLFLIGFLFSTCSDWLEVPPEKELVRNDFWKKTEDANNALAAMYSTFRSAALESFVWGELRADMVMGFPGDYSQIAGSDINPINEVIDWSKYYETINLANTLMYYDKEVLDHDKSFTQKMKDGMDAEALFLRSLCYFYLVRIWKNVPLVITPSISDTCNIYPSVTYESGIIQQITDDLLRAKDLAYTTEFQSNPAYFKGRANKYAIMALLADVYLWNQQYQKCIDYCDSITNSGLFGLQSSDSWFEMYNPGNATESIFEIQCIDDGTTDQINPFFKSVAPTWVTFIDLSRGRTVLGFNRNFNNLFSDVSDIRTCKTKSPFWKYMGVTVDDDLRRFPVSERDLNILYYRYADVMLMKAEALNEMSRVSEALDYVNQTYTRAVGQPITGISDQIEMRKVIMDERAKEFIIEGKRWFDLLRNAKRNRFQNKEIITQVILDNADARSKDVLKSKVNDTMMYYLPIPYDELKRNKNLKQNPFYER
ncbi:MAG: RagB/SusD family nutrient uptake outer membrane protein [Bacteroidales bacterium]|nr:RagB/SusD family nutrient uptake outer membrane protein [Bacteroidales bacterium]